MWDAFRDYLPSDDFHSTLHRHFRARVGVKRLISQTIFSHMSEDSLSKVLCHPLDALHCLRTLPGGKCFPVLPARNDAALLSPRAGAGQSWRSLEVKLEHMILWSTFSWRMHVYAVHFRKCSCGTGYFNSSSLRLWAVQPQCLCWFLFSREVELGSPEGSDLMQPLGKSWLLEQRAPGIRAELSSYNFGSFYFMSRFVQ